MACASDRGRVGHARRQHERTVRGLLIVCGCRAPQRDDPDRGMPQGLDDRRGRLPVGLGDDADDGGARFRSSGDVDPGVDRNVRPQIHDPDAASSQPHGEGKRPELVS